MNMPTDPVTLALRIPGKWPHPKALVERLPADYRIKGDSLLLPDGTPIELGALKADNQFAQIFRSSCRRPATEDEQATVEAYTVNVTLSGPGGSMEAARTMMRAAAAIVRAGGAGVFIDNSALAHGGKTWLAMTEDGGPDALSFAFVAIVRGKSEVWTMGMHALGLREVYMRLADADNFDIIEVIRYLSEGEKPVMDGDLISDLSGPRFQVFLTDSPEKLRGSPMHNPFGRLRLVNMRDVAESN
ncbi:MAG TPA: hypothetical protein VGP68_03800 [Gemmataceae bacterium]|jgi:hypothetical protein|nr:hypothetical protein [Gemmataceae bacterium]